MLDMLDPVEDLSVVNEFFENESYFNSVYALTQLR